MTRNSDILKEQTDERLFGYGELGDKTDDVGPNAAHKGTVVEFRTMRRRVDWDNWSAMGMSLFDYIRSINN